VFITQGDKKEQMGQLGSVVQQLRKERDRLNRELQQIDEAIEALSRIDGTGHTKRKQTGRKRQISSAARKRIAAAQRARWAKYRSQISKKSA
jgi:hypothetical protein